TGYAGPILTQTAAAGVEPVAVEPPPLAQRVVMRQRWTDLAYFHWRYQAETVQALLPDGVVVDTFDESAWVGLIPFVMRDVRLGPTPPVPYLGTFVEINVRTYVIDERGRRAVWFFSLDVPRAIIVGVARTVFSLPYCWSAGADHAVDGDHHRYTMRRSWPRSAAGQVTADIGYTVGPVIPEPTDLDHFLSARWALVTHRFGRPRYGRVHHEPWPLHRADDVEIDQSVIEAAGLPTPSSSPHALCTPGVAVSLPWFER
ncbi:MAG: YqjF family protein, partial [Ilumatobacteraceae bacterium]